MSRFLNKVLHFTLISCVFGALLVVSAFAFDVKAGKVDASTLYGRETPSTSSKIITSADRGDTVIIIDKSGDWYKVIYNKLTVYMFSEYLNVQSSLDLNFGYGIVTGSSVNFRSQPSLSAAVKAVMNKNDVVELTGVQGGWFKARYKGMDGFVVPDYIKYSATGTPSADEELAPEDTPLAESASIADQLIDYAESFLGCRYSYGSMNGKTFDCSGFTSYVFKHFGYSLNRSAAGQTTNGSMVSSRSDLKKGDLVLFRDTSINSGAASHVGIYIGDGKFIHCSSSGGGVKYNYLSDSYYNRHYIYGRRILG